MRQFFLDPEQEGGPPTVGDELTLDAEESRHLLRVLRARPGDAVRLTDGRGLVMAATLLAGGGRAARVRVVDVACEDDELKEPRLVLACGLIKGKRWEALLETAVELGVHTVVPLASRRAEVDPGSGRRRRWRTVLQTALKQSGRAWCPELSDPVGLAAFLESVSGDLFYGRARDRRQAPGTPGILDPAACATVDPSATVPENLVWCVGPEGGWDDAEFTLLAGRGCAVRLGAHRLRTATAAAAGLLLLAARREALLARSRSETGPGSAEGA